MLKIYNIKDKKEYIKEVAELTQIEWGSRTNSVEEFNNKFGKVIGQIKATDPKTEGVNRSADLKIAMYKYNKGGLEYVKDPKKQIRNLDGVALGLHTKYEIVRNSNGEIVDYQFVDMKFLPESGKENPFQRISNR